MVAQTSRYQAPKGAYGKNGTFTLTLGATLGATPEIFFAEFSDMAIAIPSGSTVTGTLTLYGSTFMSTELVSPQSGPTAPTPTFYPIINAATGNPVTLVVAAGNLYDNMKGLGFGAVASIKIVAPAAGPVEVSLKS